MTEVQSSFFSTMCRGVLAGSSLFLGLTSCSDIASSNPEVILLEGEINDQMVARFVTRTTPETRLVRIRSGGGQTLAALEMADFILEKKLAVEAVDFCIWACVQYVWMASADRRIAPDTLLAFHGGAASHLDLYAEDRDGDPRLRPSQSLVVAAEREQSLYRRLGIDPAILFAASYLRDFRCVLIVERASDGFLALLPSWDVTGTLPTMGFLGSYGVTVTRGSLPETQADLDRVLAKLGNPDLPRMVLTLPEDEALTLEQIKSRFPYNRLKECDSADTEARQAAAQAGIL